MKMRYPLRETGNLVEKMCFGGGSERDILSGFAGTNIRNFGEITKENMKKFEC